jgi:hypothetical protein
VSTAETVSDIGRLARLEKQMNMTPFSAPAEGCGDPGTACSSSPRAPRSQLARKLCPVGLSANVTLVAAATNMLERNVDPVAARLCIA